MCVSCGCGKLEDNRGDDRHLTMSDLQDAAKAANIDLEQVADNIQDAIDISASEQGGLGSLEEQGASTRARSAID